MAELNGSSLIEFFVEAFYQQTINPQSKLFLPTLIKGQTNPTYEPYIAGVWTPADMPLERKGAENICTSVATTQSLMPSPNVPTVLRFKDVTIAGLSNVSPSEPQFNGDVVSLKASFSTLSPNLAPTPMTVSGNFTLEQACCQTEDFKSCSGPSRTYLGSGPFAIQVANSNVAASALVVPTPDEKLLTATVLSLAYEASADPTNISIRAEITSISNPKEREEWDAFAASVLNSEEVRSALIEEIKAVLAQQSTLDSLSALVTEGLQSLMRSSV